MKIPFILSKTTFEIPRNCQKLKYQNSLDKALYMYYLYSIFILPDDIGIWVLSHVIRILEGNCNCDNFTTGTDKNK